MQLKPFLREAIVPHALKFISTVSKDGVRNIAPYACVMPVLRPLDLIAVASAPNRDTLRNIRETGQFVVNLAGIDMADKVVPTARHSAPEADEFELAGLTEKPSQSIKAPGIAGCYAWMECELVKEYTEERFVLLLARVVRLEVRDDVMKPDGSLDVVKARPLMMVGTKRGMNFCTAREVDQEALFSNIFPEGHDPLAHQHED